MVVGEVDVEVVGLGEPHHVDDAAKGFGRVGITSHIDEEGAEGEVGLVLDFDAWELPFSGGVFFHELKEGGCGAGHSHGGGGVENEAAGGLNAVLLTFERIVVKELEGRFLGGGLLNFEGLSGEGEQGLLKGVCLFAVGFGGSDGGAENVRAFLDFDRLGRGKNLRCSE